LPAFQSLPDAHPEEALFLEKALVAVTNLDTLALDQVYQKAQVSFGDQGLLRRVIAPLARDIGERWRAGLMTAAQEHFFSAFSKNFAWNLTRQYEVDERAPKIVVGTPAGQIHDLGAMIVAAAAANNGWRVVYVGANLPAFELAGAVQISGAAVLVLSIVYPEDDPKLQNELTHLGRLLPQETKLYVGGRAARAYFPDLKRSRAMVLSSLEELDRELDAARKASSLQPGLR
jgi:methanogenic corrinoid protein MtbC1